MKKVCHKFALFLLLTGMTYSGIAQEKGEEEKDKFSQLIQEFPYTESVYLQEKGELQQTLNAGHTEEDEQIGNSLSYEMEYGITDWFQLSAGYSYDHWNTENIPYNTNWIEAGAELGLLNSSKQAAVLAFEAEFPVKKAGVEEIETEDKPAYSPSLLYAIQFNKTQLHLNAGAEFQDKEVNWFYNAAAVYGTGNLHPLVEINAVSEEEFKWYVGTGLVLNSENGWEVSAGARHGIDNSNWGATLNLIYELSLAGDK